MPTKETKARLKPIEKAAYHEAGHVVANYLMGFEVEVVTIIPDENSLGYSESKVFSDDFDVERFRLDRIEDYELFFKAVAVGLGGYVSEYKASGRRNWISTETDFSNIDDLLTLFQFSESLQKGICITAADYLTDVFEFPHVWALVQAIVSALMVKKTLNKKEIADLIHDNFPDDPRIQ